KRGGFTGALKADDHDLDGRLDLEVEFARLTAHRPRQFIGNEPDEMLLGSERAEDFLSERLLLDVIDKVADDADIDVGLEQGETDLPEGFLDIAFGDAPVPAKFLEDPFESVAKRVEHRSDALDSRGRGTKSWQYPSALNQCSKPQRLGQHAIPVNRGGRLPALYRPCRGAGHGEFAARGNRGLEERERAAAAHDAGGAQDLAGSERAHKGELHLGRNRPSAVLQDRSERGREQLIGKHRNIAALDCPEGI